MLKDEEINEIIITYMDDYSTTMLDMCRSVEKSATSEIEQFISAVESQVKIATQNIETGNDYDGLIRLKGLELAFRLRRETT